MTEAASERTTIRLHDDLSLQLSREERLRLLIRVMCELVAYDAVETSDACPRSQWRERARRRRRAGRCESRASASGSPQRSRAVGSASALASESSGSITV